MSQIVSPSFSTVFWLCYSVFAMQTFFNIVEFTNHLFCCLCILTQLYKSLPKLTVKYQFSSVQLLSSVQLFATPWTTARQASLSITNFWSPPKLMSIQPFHALSSPSPPALNLPQHQGFFKWVSSSHQVAKVLEFQLQHQSFQWTPRTDLL